MKWSSLFNKQSAAVIASLTLALSLAPSYHNAAHAASLEQIRVALFIDSPKYSLVEPAVSLAAEEGFLIQVRGEGIAPLADTVSPAIRASLDQYSVLMLETADFAAAKSLYGKLAGMQADSYVLSRSKQGKAVFQVYYGSFASLEEAAGFREQAVKDPAVAAMIKGAAPEVKGPLHWSAGSFATEAEAVQQAAVLSQAGLPADAVIQQGAAGPAYGVWIGAESTPEQLNAVKQLALQLQPGLQLQPANTAAAYVLRRTDVSGATAAAEGVPHYAAGAAGQKTLFQPKQGGVTLKERGGRSYRGAIEISAYRGKLAVVNELPFEQYLYGVVSSELGAGWPAEALKAQAVAARTYALKQGTKYEIAHVTDTTLDQAYMGLQREFAAAVQAVDATKGEVLTDANGLITPVYSSNAGGMTADPAEVWGNPAAYLKSVPSPDDGAAAGKAVWYRIRLADGRSAYVHSMYLRDTGAKNAEGQAYYEATEGGVNVRLAPYVDNAANPAIDQLEAKERVTMIGQETESNAYSWVRGPYDAAFVEDKLKAAGVTLAGGLQSLEISKRGPSGRVVEMKANGQVIKVPYPDAFRSLFGGLPSTRFEIEGTGSYTSNANANRAGGPSLEGAAGARSSASGAVYALTGTADRPVQTNASGLAVLGASGTAVLQPPATGSSVASGQQYVFRGTGFGHGLGMSQWGARGYAELGFDYKKILQTYYNGVTISKE